MVLQGEVTSHDQNLRYLDLAVRAYTERQGGVALHRAPPPPPTTTANARTRKRDAEGLPKNETDPPPAASPPFGPHLVPVPPSSERLQDRGDPHPKSPPPAPDCTPEPGRDCGRTHADSPGGGAHRPISTNDLLECLVHPEVIAMVTKLLMSRQGTQGCV